MNNQSDSKTPRLSQVPPLGAPKVKPIAAGIPDRRLLRGLLGLNLCLLLSYPVSCPSAAAPLHPLQNWHLNAPAEVGRQVHGVAYANGQWVAVGNIRIRSTNAVQWAGSAVPNETLRTVLWDGHAFVAAGGSSQAGHNAPILASTDGSQWQVQRVLNANSAAIFAGTVGPKGPVLVGENGTVHRQVNTREWDWERNIGPNQPTEHLYAVTSGPLFDGQTGYLAVGARGAIWISGSGGPARWSRSQAVGVTGRDLRGVVYGKGHTERLPHAGLAAAEGRYVAVGDRTILTSSDGVNWTPVRTAVERLLHQVVYHAGHFVAVGDQGILLYSSHGDVWTEVHTGVNSTLSGVCYSGRTFVATSVPTGSLSSGVGGAILQSDPIVGFDRPPRRLSSIDSPSLAGQWQLEFMTELGRAYRLESSTDLTIWKNLGDFQGIGWYTPVTDLTAVEDPQRFYRLLIP